MQGQTAFRRLCASAGYELGPLPQPTQSAVAGAWVGIVVAVSVVAMLQGWVRPYWPPPEPAIAEALAPSDPFSDVYLSEYSEYRYSRLWDLAFLLIVVGGTAVGFRVGYQLGLPRCTHCRGRFRLEACDCPHCGLHPDFPAMAAQLHSPPRGFVRLGLWLQETVLQLAENLLCSAIGFGCLAALLALAVYPFPSLPAGAKVAQFFATVVAEATLAYGAYQRRSWAWFLRAFAVAVAVILAAETTIDPQWRCSPPDESFINDPGRALVTAPPSAECGRLSTAEGLRHYTQEQIRGETVFLRFSGTRLVGQSRDELLRALRVVYPNQEPQGSHREAQVDRMWQLSRMGVVMGCLGVWLFGLGWLDRRINRVIPDPPGV